MRKTKKAIYFNGEYNQFNVGKGIQCITYDEVNGFQFVDDGKVITIPTATDKEQSAEIESLISANISQHEDITSLLTLVETQHTKISGLTESLNSFKQITESLNSTQSEDIAELLSGVSTQNNNISILASEIDELIGINAEQAAQITSLEATNISLNTTINALKGLTNALINQQPAGELIVGDTVTLGSTALSGTYKATEEVPNIQILGGTVDNQVVLTNAKTVSIDSLKLNINEAMNGLTINAENSVNVNSLELNGTISGSTNQIDITSAQDIKIDNATVTATGYNGLMLAQYEETNVPSSIIIENMRFEGELTNNSLTFGSLTENAKVIIRDCYFGKCYNPLRFRNQLNASGIQVLVENCHFEELIKDPESGRCGLILFEDIVTWPVIKEANPLQEGETEAARVARLYPELINTELESNRFGSDKFTITFKNCTYGSEKLLINSDEYGNYFGTGNAEQLVCIVLHSNRRTFLKYAPVPDSTETTYFCKPFPYTETPYLAEFLGDTMDPIPTGGAQYYPTIKFE